MNTSCSNLYSLLEAQVAARGDAVALIDGRGRSYTYRQVLAAADLRAAGAQRCGLQPGARVLIGVRPGIEFFATVYGLLKHGCVVVFIDPGMPRSLLRETLGRASLTAVTGNFWLLLAFRLGVLPLARGARLVRLRAAADTSPTPAHSTATRDDVAVLYTSGGTGTPKPVRYTQGMFLSQLDVLQSQFGLQVGQREMSGFPLFSLLTLLGGLVAVLAPAGTSRPARAPGRRIVEAISRHRVDIVSGSPTIWLRVAEAAGRRHLTLNGVRQVLMFGAPVRREWLEVCQKIFPAARLSTPYGATESLPLTAPDHELLLSSDVSERTRNGGGTCLGWPVPETEVQILSEQSYLPATGSRIGELLVRCDRTTPGYLGLPEATARAGYVDAQQRRWHRMGDLGYFDDTGKLWFCGRKAHAVGQLLPIPIENAFLDIPGVRRAALVSLSGRPAVALEVGTFADRLRGAASRQTILAAAATRCLQRPELTAVGCVVLVARMPLDGRHQIKIDRLKLGQELSREMSGHRSQRFSWYRGDSSAPRAGGSGSCFVASSPAALTPGTGAPSP